MGKWTRRAVIGTGLLAGGAFAVGVALRPGNPVAELKPLVGGKDDELINSWVLIDKDNVVTAIVPHTEMGQGVRTSLGQMLADELDADWEKVQVIEAPTTGDYVAQHMARHFVAPFTEGAPPWIEPSIDGLFTRLSKLVGGYATGGSASVRATGQRGMRVAGAAAREMLIAAAAAAWGVPASAIRTENSTLFHDASGKSAPYADFARAASEQVLPTNPKLKKPSEFKLMGKSLPRVEILGKVNGTAQYGIDAEVPEQDLKYAAVLLAPVIGTTVKSMNANTAKSMPGVHQVHNMSDFVAVVADGYWQAQQAVNAVDVEWTTTPNSSLDQAGLYERFTRALDATGEEDGTLLVNDGDVAAAYSSAATQVEAEYTVPFLAHAPMEPVNCTAWVHDGICDIWTSTQVPLFVRAAAATAIGFSQDQVNLHQMDLGGGFGRRLRDDYGVIGARIAQATQGIPVKTIFSREEDIQKAYYRTSTKSRLKAGLDKNGNAVSFDHLFIRQEDPPEAPLIEYYDIVNTRIRVLNEVDMHLRFGDWRSVDASQLSFFIESFVDEMAHGAEKDPFDFRMDLLRKSPRHRAVLQGAAEMANWGGSMQPGHARGIAIIREFGTIVAQVAEVDMTSGAPQVTKVFCCADPGFAINPDGFVAQMESSIVFGLTAALYGEISLKDGAVMQSNFHDYEMLRINETPQMEVKIINGDSDNLGGGGEPGLPPIAPAVCNAIFAATGRRVRELPLMKQNFA